MKRSSFSLHKACTPAILYFMISFLALIIVGLNNLGQSDKLCLGVVECSVGNNVMIFLLNALYILFWTFVLDLMCKNGWGDLSWFIFLLPFILVFLFYSFIIFSYR